MLNSLMKGWFETSFRAERPDCRLGYEDLLENPPDRILNLTRADYLNSLDRFRFSGHYDRLSPAPAVMDWFQNNGKRYRHLALTAVPIKCAGISANWVLQHFGEWIRTFHFVPSSRHEESIPVYDANKGEYLKWLGKVDLLVDDNIDNVRSARMTGIRGLVYPQPWNGSQARLDDIERLLCCTKVERAD